MSDNSNLMEVLKMGSEKENARNCIAIQERRRKLAEWYDQYETVAEILLDCEFKGAIKKGKLWMESFRPEMVWKLAGDVSNKRVLDIGCQYGVFSFFLSEKGASVTGIDISKKWVERCLREASTRRDCSKMEFRICDAQELAFDDESFDIVVCTEVIEHVDYAGNVLSEINRVLVPGGILVLGTPNTGSYYVKIWNILKMLLPMKAIRWILKKILTVSQEDAYQRVRRQLPEERRAEFDREIKKLEELNKQLEVNDPGKEEFSEHIREFSLDEIETLLNLMGFKIEKRTGFPVFPTYYFLSLRMLIREWFIKVKDNSRWRYRSAPFVYIRAVKKEPPIFHI